MNVNQSWLQTLRATVAPLSPRHRRWKQFLGELRLDPTQLSSPVASPTSRDFIICGCPRTGTTLLSALLFQPPAIITVMEPWAGMRLPPAELFASIREEVAVTGTLKQGKLDVEALLKERVVRWGQEGKVGYKVEVNPNYLLGVKWPTFWQYLQLLRETKFLVCIRHPFEVISSFKKIRGRVALGLEYEIAFNRKLNHELQSATHDIALRRILLYDYVNSRILPHLLHPNVFVVRYERWFTELEQLTAEIGAFLGVQLKPGSVIIRSSEKKVELNPSEISLIKQHCRTAEALGYNLEGAPG